MSMAMGAFGLPSSSPVDMASVVEEVLANQQISMVEHQGEVQTIAHLASKMDGFQLQMDQVVSSLATLTSAIQGVPTVTVEPAAEYKKRRKEQPGRQARSDGKVTVDGGGKKNQDQEEEEDDEPLGSPTTQWLSESQGRAAELAAQLYRETPAPEPEPEPEPELYGGGGRTVEEGEAMPEGSPPPPPL